MTQKIPDTAHYDKCRKRLELHEQLFTARAVLMFILTVSNALFNQFGSGSFEFLFSGLRGLTAAFPLAILSLLSGLVIIALVIAAREKRLFLIFAVVLTAILAFLKLLFLPVAIVFFIAELTLFLQLADLDVLKTKEGYPQFNIRFTEQKAAGCDYKPPYDISSRTEEMPEIGDIPDNIDTQEDTI